MTNDTSPIGEKLKALRVRAGQSIREACAVVGMKTPSAWKHYEDDVNRKSIPADMVIDLLRVWEGKGDPAISTEDVLALSPNLMMLFQDTGRNFNSDLHIERENIKLNLRVEARSLDDVRALIAQWADSAKVEK